MSDHDIRTLERASRADPSNEQKRDALELAWLRAGLGWHGEKMPSAKLCQVGPVTLVAAYPERGIYELMVQPMKAVGAVGFTEPLIRMQFVYVPGGEVSCPRHHNGDEEARIVCQECSATKGKKVIAPFYIGRFPVTWSEWWPFDLEAPQAWSRSLRDGALATDARHHPVVNVSLQDAKEFCSWAGLRLPTSEEWRWAALGGPDPDALYAGASCAICKAPLEKTGKRAKGEMAYVTARCPTHGESNSVHFVEPRRYPWGNEPPTPERCVWAGYLDSQFAQFGATRPGGVAGFSARLTTTMPVVEWLCPSKSGEGYVKPKAGLCVAESLEYPAHSHTARCRLVPARPSGASWCGAQDMAGNVWEWVAEGSAHGGSFRNDLAHTPGPHGFGSRLGRWDHQQDAATTADDVGFRVALSAGDAP